jgi:glutamine amidotransferase
MNKYNKVAIIDYGLSNSSSVLNMIKWIGGDAIITSNHQDIKNATHLILPGVGAFDSGMDNLQKSHLIDLLNHEVLENEKPILGICLGMQLLLDSSEEGEKKGLGWIKGYSKKFIFDDHSLKVPHMGWNYINIENQSQIVKDLDDAKFYFVHSYFVNTAQENILTTTNYGHGFVSGIQKENIYGFQFHPEKSHKYGMQLFKNFLEIHS